MSMFIEVADDEFTNILCRVLRVPDGWLVIAAATRWHAGASTCQSLIRDRSHLWVKPDKWELIVHNENPGKTEVFIYRLKVPDGWIVMTLTTRYETGVSLAQTFIDDKAHAWRVLPEPPGPNPGPYVEPSKNWPRSRHNDRDSGFIE